MKKSPPYGIRYTSDAELVSSGADGGFLGSTLELLESHFRGSGNDFYFDYADVDQHVFGGVKCQDVLGWVVPDSESDAFRAWWLSARPGDEDDSYPYAMVTWVAGPDGRPEPRFDLGEDA